jgi:hypothetical protein
MHLLDPTSDNHIETRKTILVSGMEDSYARPERMICAMSLAPVP